MDLSAWVVYTFLAALAVAAAVLHYRVREPGGRSRTPLALLRGAALALLVLLLFDPLVPTGDAGDRITVALVDASLSMSLADADGRTRWEAARAEIADAEADRVLLFGAGEGAAVADLGAMEPTAPRSRLAPALRSAVETGPTRVVVLTDGAVDDLAEAAAVAAGSGVAVDVRVVGDPTPPNVAVEAVRAPAWLAVGEPTSVEVGILHVGSGDPALGDSVVVVISGPGGELARARVPLPPAGGSSAAELTVRVDSAAAGPVRLDLRVAPGGAVADDDVRSVYVRIADEPAGVALVSFRPDQEPRFLLPVLERALGLPVRGWLTLPGDRHVRVGTGREAGRIADTEAVRGAVSNAGLVVFHGLGSDSPEWARAAAARAERLLVLPGDPPPSLPVAPGPLQPGEWYLAQDVPSSPVAAMLAGVAPTGVPPLTGLRTFDTPPGYWAPLRARAGRSGPDYPVLVAGREAERRVAVALGEGYWRWAFAGGEGRDLYWRLWSAVASWLMEGATEAERQRVRPVSRVVARGEPLVWAIAEDTDSLELTITRQDGGAALDTVLPVEASRAVTPSLPPGHYRYTARAAGATATGPVTVESYSPELTDQPRPVELESGSGTGARPIGARPLHTTPWPYIAIAVLLCTEWVLRRRWGLR